MTAAPTAEPMLRYRHLGVLAKMSEMNIQDFSNAEMERVFDNCVSPQACRRGVLLMRADRLTLEEAQGRTPVWPEVSDRFCNELSLVQALESHARDTLNFAPEIAHYFAGALRTTRCGQDVAVIFERWVLTGLGYWDVDHWRFTLDLQDQQHTDIIARLFGPESEWGEPQYP